MCDCDKIKQTDEYVVGWRCWVEVNGEIKEYNSVDDNWCDIPNDSFQAMRLWYSDNTSRVISGNDFYFIQQHNKGLIFGQTNDTDVKERYPGAIIKRGKHIPDLMMKEINELMSKSEKPQYAA